MMEDQCSPLMDCLREPLVSSDAAIVQVQHWLIGAARALASEAYAYHSARLMVDADILVEQVVAEIEALAMQKSWAGNDAGPRVQPQTTCADAVMLPSSLSREEGALIQHMAVNNGDYATAVCSGSGRRCRYSCTSSSIFLIS